MALPSEASPSFDRAALFRLVEALTERGCNPRQRDDHVDARCPAHEDRHASFSADWRQGAVYVCCHRDDACSTDDIVAALGLAPRDLYDVPGRRRNAPVTSIRRPGTQPARSASASKPRKVQRPQDDPRRWPIVERWTYCDEQGEVLGEICKKQHPERNIDDPDDNRKTFLWRRLNAYGRWVWGAPERRPLYRLPAVLAAIAEGTPVWLVEGEKDADAVTALGQCATTAPGGACKWLPEHTQTLTGAHVVIVRDRDDSGQRHASQVATALDGVAASVRVLDPAAGKDVSAHLTAGLTLDALLPAVAPAEPADDPQHAQTGKVIHAPFGRRGGDGGLPPIRVDQVERDVYSIVDGCLVKLPAGKHKAKILFNATPRVVRRVRRDLGDGSRVTVSHVDLEVSRDEQVEQLPMVAWEDFEKVTWAADLRWTDIQFARTSQGRSDVVNGIVATSGEVDVVTAYATTGWRLIDNQWHYIHAGGAINAAGPVEQIRTDLAPELSGYTLPDPPPLDDHTALRTALDASLAVLRDLPARIAAPLLGAAYRAALGPCNVTVFLLGTFGTYKSGLGALALQHYMPSASHKHLTMGAGEEASTITGLEEVRFIVGHALVVADDLAPDRGSERMIQRANMLARSQYNQTGKFRGAKTGGLRATHKPRGLLMLTGEDGGSGSGESRMLYIPVAPGDVDLDALKGLSRRPAPTHRAAWMASLVRHLAGRMPLDDWLSDTAGQLADALRDPSAAQEGTDARTAGMVAELATGWRAMLDAALALGILDRDEADQLWHHAWDGLLSCKAAQGQITTRRRLHERAADLLRSAIIAGHAHIEARDGGRPEDPELLGWQPATSSLIPGSSALELRAQGDRVGWRDGDRLLLDKGAAFAAMERQGRAQSDPLGVTTRALAEAMASADVLATRMEGDQVRYDTKVRIGRARPLVWSLPFTWLYPDDTAEDDPAPSAAQAPQAPTSPTPPTSPEQVDPSPDVPQDVPKDVPELLDVSTTGQDVPAGRQDVSTTHPDVPARPHTSTPPTAGPRFRAAAVVVDVDQAWLTGTPTKDFPAIDPPQVDTVADLLAWAQDLRLGTPHDYCAPDDGQVWVMPALAARLGLPAEPYNEKQANRNPAITALHNAGWSTSKAGLDRPWLTAWRDAGRSLRLALPGWMTESECMFVEGNPDAATLAVRLGLYVEHLRLPWRVSAAITGVDLMNILRPAGSRLGLPHAVEPPPPARHRTLEDPYNWQRTPTAEEARKKYIHVGDKNGQFLAAASRVLLGRGHATHRENCRFDPKLPGYWRIHRDSVTWSHPLLPNPIPREIRGDYVWVTTPTLALLVEKFDADVSPIEAYVYEDHAGLLEPWYEHLRDARKALMSSTDPDAKVVLAALKRTYAAAVGRLDAETTKGDPRHRPDHRHLIMATARANLTFNLLQATKTGTPRYPLVVAADAVAYASDNPNFEEDFPLRQGNGLGAWKPVITLPMQEALPYLKGATRPSEKRGFMALVEKYLDPQEGAE